MLKGIGKAVQVRHGRATVSGEPNGMDATVPSIRSGDCAGMGRRREATIRESGNLPGTFETPLFAIQERARAGRIILWS